MIPRLPHPSYIDICQAGLFRRTVNIEGEREPALILRYRRPLLIGFDAGGLQTIKTNGCSELVSFGHRLTGKGDPRELIPLDENAQRRYNFEWNRMSGEVTVMDSTNMPIFLFQQLNTIGFHIWRGRLNTLVDTETRHAAIGLAAHLWTFFENERRATT